MRTSSSAAVIAAIFFAATVSGAHAQSLTQEFSIESQFPSYSALSQSDAEFLLRPAEEWRQEALAWTSPNAERQPSDGFRLLQRAHSINTQGRDLPGEFLYRVSDADLEAIFEFASEAEPTSGDALASRLRLASDVIARVGLSDLHARAYIERGKMLTLLGGNKNEIAEAFSSATQVSGVSEGTADQARGFQEATTSPHSPRGYWAANELMNGAVANKRREVGTFQAVRVLRAVEGKGVESLFNGENTASLEAGRAAIRAGFEMGRLGVVRQVAAEVQTRVEDNPELAAEALYFAAMAEFAEDSYAEAIPAFERVIQLVPESEFAGAALCRIGTCHIQLREYGDAVLALDDARISYGSFEEVGASANRQIDILISSGLLTAYEVQQALAAPRKPRPSTSAMLISSKGGK
jgi:tetratricopeptide (TPR) repeat protein